MTSSAVPTPQRVYVASEHALVAEAVSAALMSRGFEATVLRWPDEPVLSAVRRRRPSRTRPESGLLVSDLDRWSRVRAARLLVRRVEVPWVALTSSPRGPVWGAVLAAGARGVLPASARLDQVSDLLAGVVERPVSMPADDRRSLEDSWERLRTRHDVVSERLAALTPREHEVLRLMYAGSPVARIAEMLDVSPATVRSQVKSVLQKLDVSSQLAAVAMFGDALDALPPVPAPRQAEVLRPTAGASPPGAPGRQPPAARTPGAWRGST